MKWENSDIETLKEMYNRKESVKVIAENLNRTEKSIINKANVLGISNNRFFTKEEDEFLKENYQKMNLVDLAKSLNRGENYQNVCRRARKLGLTNKKDNKIRNSERPEPKTKYRIVDGVKTRRKYDTDEERIKAQTEFLKNWHKNNEHPRGMKGKTHSEKYKKQLSERMTKNWEDESSFFNSEEYRDKLSERMSKTMSERIKKNPKSIYSNAKGGTREDLGFYVRSRWEANVARYLKHLEEKEKIYKWEYEPDTFWFENIKRGTRSYLPDFKVWYSKESKPIYWEVKGHMDAKSKTKLKRMKKYHPDVVIKLIMQKEYNEMKRVKDKIKNWENDR
jgi:hypothetical protein